MNPRRKTLKYLVPLLLNLQQAQSVKQIVFLEIAPLTVRVGRVHIANVIGDSQNVVVEVQLAMTK